MYKTATVTSAGLAEIERALRRLTKIREGAIEGAARAYAAEIEAAAERGEEWGCELPRRLTRSGNPELVSIEGVIVTDSIGGDEGAEAVRS